jgi:hypothetical protein
MLIASNTLLEKNPPTSIPAKGGDDLFLDNSIAATRSLAEIGNSKRCGPTRNPTANTHPPLSAPHPSSFIIHTSNLPRQMGFCNKFHNGAASLRASPISITCRYINTSRIPRQRKLIDEMKRRCILTPLYPPPACTSAMPTARYSICPRKRYALFPIRRNRHSVGLDGPLHPGLH